MFNLFKKQPKQESKEQSKQKQPEKDWKKEIEEKAREREEDRKMSEEYRKIFQNADELYKSGNKDEAVSIYEKTVHEMLQFGSRRLNLRAAFDLCEMYSDMGRMDDAWRVTNEVQMSVMRDGYDSFTDKIRFQQYKILKKEGRNVNALEFLMVSWYLKNADVPDMNQNYILREGKTVAKGAGLSTKDLQELAEKAVALAKSGSKDENDIRNLYESYMREKGFL